jgi:hypothetical protein
MYSPTRELIPAQAYSVNREVIAEYARRAISTTRAEVRNKDIKSTDFEMNRKILEVELNNKELHGIVQELKKSFKTTTKTVAGLKSEVKQLTDEKVKLELKMAQQSYLSCFGLQQHEIENSITLPLRIYVTDVAAKPYIENLLLKENENIAFEAIGPDIEGSWYKEIYYKFKGDNVKKYKDYAEK